MTNSKLKLPYVDVTKVAVPYGDGTRTKNKIRAVLRGSDGIRIRKDFDIVHKFYVTDPDTDSGLVSINGDPVSEIVCRSFYDKRDMIEAYANKGLEVWETDVRDEHLVIEEHLTDTVLKPNISIFDIEVDVDPKLGFPEPQDIMFPINAVSNHNKWKDEYRTLVLTPDTIDIDTAIRLLKGEISQDSNGNIIDTPADDEFGDLLAESNWKLFETEEELLVEMISLWMDTDIWSGWNSEKFDVPYIIQRIRHVLGGEDRSSLKEEFTNPNIRRIDCSQESKRALTSLCSAMDKLPEKKTIKQFGNDVSVYETYGIIALDYLNLYKKYTLGEEPSYKLDNILEKEIRENKVAYDGSLFTLYRNDFRRFVAYSFQDTRGLSRLDDKKQFIALANQMIHMAGVRFPDALGSVALIERAMMKEYHKRNIILNDRRDITYFGYEEEFPVPGAYVLNPIPGLITEGGIAAYDYNSLYPSIIRTLNIDPQTIVAFLDVEETLKKIRFEVAMGKTPTEAWSQFAGTTEYQEVILQTDTMIRVISEDDRNVTTMKAKDVYQMLLDYDLTITPFGLIIANDEYGIIPSILTKWYEQRVESKNIIKKNKKLMEGDIDKVRRAELEHEKTVHDSIQQAMKTLLNSSYGAMANKYFRMYDPRMASSITLAGRMLLLSMSYGLETLLDTEPIL